ncbi:MAG: hypothetical protein IKK19_05035 [Bacteroidales bacterium]|nr:hypothetical protein [Bacteroidales bacterium]
MIKGKISKLADEFRALSPTAKGMVVLCIILIIGILLRWDATIEGIKQGFGFFSGK